MLRTKDVVRQIAKKTRLKSSYVRDVLRELIGLIEAETIDGTEVSLNGFGKFSAQVKPPKKMHSHFVGGEVMSHGKILISFTQFESRKKHLWGSSVFPKVFKENDNVS